MADKQKTVFVVGIVAIVIAAVAAYALYNYMRGQEQRAREAVATQPVVVASVEIPAGTSIDADKVKMIDWPKASLPMGSFTTTEQILGRVPTERLIPGEPITEAKLVPREGVPGILTYKIPAGHRAMTVAVDQVAGVAGFITPGSKVDVVLITTPPGATQPISKIIPTLQNISVLAIGQIVEQKEGQPVVVPTVTMDVTPAQAEDLGIASTQGRLQLVLRRAGDTEPIRTAGATVTRVLGGAQPMAVVTDKKPDKKVKVAKREEKPAEVKPTVQPPPPPPPHVIEVIKGTSRTTEQFKTQ